ncbi:MAG: hydrogenase maturation nickel metallochaperone HypA [Bacteroidetes bacterium]|nr:hydrogenase maturation nickel metallochaperone HypA [Bacteroidota bacterium]
MHELSLALDVIDLVTEEAGKNSLKDVYEIHIEVGEISGVDADVFQRAMEIVLKNSSLGKAKVKIRKTPGIGRCTACDKDFSVSDFLACCPGCNGYPSEIIGGKELRVTSIIGE